MSAIHCYNQWNRNNGQVIKVNKESVELVQRLARGGGEHTELAAGAMDILIGGKSIFIKFLLSLILIFKNKKTVNLQFAIEFLSISRPLNGRWIMSKPKRI